jgi:Spherulation-specific family 4
MRFRGFVAVVALSVIPFAVGCAQPEVIPVSDGTGGTTSTASGTAGAATGSGGSQATGGDSATGGAPATGGSTGQGGAVATGGERATGGSTGQGGAPATGGSTGQAGATTTGGGGTGRGGAPATGGSTGTGGSAATGTGGRVSTGTGGSSVTGTGGHTSTGSGGASTTGAAGHGSTGGAGSSAGGSTGTGGSTTGTAGSTATGAGGSTVTGAAGSSMTATGGTTSTAGGTIVPLYTDPSDPSWNAIISAAEAHPTVHVVAIVNPADGPGSSKSSAYTTGIAGLQAAGIKVIGYVATGYGSHSIASMEAQMDSWKSFYPTLQGIFFDEQSNSTGDVAHYQTLSQYAKSIGLGYTVGNPGTGVPTAYVGAVDTMLIYESDGVPPMSDLSAYSAYAPSNFGVIPYAVSSMNTTFVQQARKYVQYVYLTNDDLPNPWDSLTSYFSSLLAALE